MNPQDAGVQPRMQKDPNADEMLARMPKRHNAECPECRILRRVCKDRNAENADTESIRTAVCRLSSAQINAHRHMKSHKR